MIKPTVGRVVLFHPAPTDGMMRLLSDQPHAAMGVFVYSETKVNLVVYDHYGVPHQRTGIQLVQGDEPRESSYAEWMPYQKGQAAKTEALETKLKKG